MTIAFLLVPILWVLVDVCASLRARRYIDATMLDGEFSDFNVLVPIYGNTKYLENLDFLRQYGKKVILCTASGESIKFYEDLNKIKIDYGLQVFVSPYKVDEHSEKKRTGGVIRDQVIKDALNSLDNLGKYVVCIDADTTCSESLDRLVGALEKSSSDFASVELVPQDEGGALVQLQRHEYRQSMRMRHLLPWMISGACHVFKTDTLRRVMRQHSLFFQGNDVEAGLLGDQLGYKSIHLPFKVSTEVPTSFRSWWRQRIAWSGGEFRLFITNIRYLFYYPLLWAYGAVITIALTAGRWYSLVEPGWLLLIVVFLYYIAVIYIHWSTRNWWLLLLPLYSLFNSLIMTPIGVIWYFVMAIPERNFGVINPKREKDVIV